MKKAIIKLSVFAGVFLISLVVISFFMNQGNRDMTSQMGAATLPTISIRCGETQINQMYGYSHEMEPAGMRESITPVGEQRQVEAVIETYGQKIESAGFEVRSVDGQRLVEKTELTGLEQNETQLLASFRLKDLIEEGREYSLIFILNLEDGREVRYYTRIIQADYDLEEKLAFITGFSNATLNAGGAGEEQPMGDYASKLEPGAEGDNSTLARVDIHSTASQVAWAGVDVQKESDAEIQIREIAAQTASATLSYLVSYPKDGERAFAQVEEYFRVRYTGDTMYLLDYERRAEQIFAETSDSFSSGNIDLGVADSDVEMKESDGGTVLAFSQAGSLYSYNGANSSLARLFSFYDAGKEDSRTLNDRHGFRILHVDETGNVMFLVHGYMNRGRHEGYCGIQVCYYSSTLNVMEELAFLPYTKSPDILEAEMENLSFANGKNDLYLMLDGSIYRIGLEDQSAEIVAEGLDEDGYRVSEDGSMLVWEEDGQADFARSLVLMNLNTGESESIEAGEGNFIRPLGFMGQDLIYGIARQEDIQEDDLGYTVFPMFRVEIRDFNGEIYKTWQQDGFYVTGCTIEGNQINLERVSAATEGLAEAGAEQILYSDEIAESQNSVETAVTEELETIVRISLRSQADSKKVKILTPGEVLFEGSREVALEKAEHPERYYVYGKNGVVDILSSPAKAAELAYENLGTAAAEDGSYVLKRDRLHSSNQIMAIEGILAEDGESSLAVCLDAIFRFEGLMRDSQHLLDQGMDVLSILEQNLEGRRILDLRGCSLDIVLYYPDREIPVLAVQNDGSAVLITGFNEQNVVLMNPQTGTVYKMGMNDAREWFAENGNRFIAYW